MANWYNYINFVDEWDSREWPLYDKRKSMALPALLIFPLTLLNIDKMNQTEIWKPVVGLEDYYMISNIGRIKSVERIVIHSDGRKRNIGGKILNTSILCFLLFNRFKTNCFAPPSSDMNRPIFIYHDIREVLISPKLHSARWVE